jgi:2,3-dihydroxybenzoate decarboxylase/5-carboxyvanillate decarboxylase
MDRRTALINLSSFGAAAAFGALERANAQQSGEAPRLRKLRKIATEEAWTIPEVATALRDVVRAGGNSLDLPLLATIYDAPTGNQPRFCARPLPRCSCKKCLSTVRMYEWNLPFW